MVLLLSEGIAEVRSSETGRIVGIIDLEAETIGEARFSYNRAEGHVREDFWPRAFAFLT
jgi:hypothetical protein